MVSRYKPTGRPRGRPMRSTAVPDLNRMREELADELMIPSGLTLEVLQEELARRASHAEREKLDKSVEAVRDRCSTLFGFIKEAWHVLHPPTTLYLEGPHIKFLAAHLEAITYGRFLDKGLDNRLLINIPPGCMKSLLVTVFWPAWEWGPANMAWMQYIATSFRDDFCKRDCRKMRALIESKWYQTLWPMELIRANDSYLENDKLGWRNSVPFGSLTGGRAHRLLIDDPHSVDTAESDADRERARMRFHESVPTRVADVEKSAIVLIMQRLHANDLSYHASKLGYIHIRLPMEFEADERCVTPLGQDWRKEEGELLFPNRFTREVLARDKAAMTQYAIAGQLQQRPSPREGGLFKRFWFDYRILTTLPPEPEMMKVADASSATWIRHWDLAGTGDNKRSARTCGVKMGKTRDGRYIIASVITTRLEGAGVRKLIKETAESDGKNCEVSLPQDPGQAGKEQAKDYVAITLDGYVAHYRREDGDKIQRAEPFSAQCEIGNVYLLQDYWNESWLDEVCLFPNGFLKDQVDAASGAYARLPKGKPMNFSRPFVETLPRNVPALNTTTYIHWEGNLGTSAAPFAPPGSDGDPRGGRSQWN